MTFQLVGGRYAAYAGSQYYPRGGQLDLVVKGAETVEDAVAELLNRKTQYDWWHVVDRTTGDIIRRSA